MQFDEIYSTEKPRSGFVYRSRSEPKDPYKPDYRLFNELFTLYCLPIYDNFKR